MGINGLFSSLKQRKITGKWNNVNSSNSDQYLQSKNKVILPKNTKIEIAFCNDDKD